jgi:hypothetical protein
VTEPVEVILFPVREDVFHDPDPVVQLRLDERVRELAVHKFGHDRVRVEALTEVELDGVDWPDYVFLRVTARVGADDHDGLEPTA